MQENLIQREVTDRIINRFYHVYNTLGVGFLEKVYENSLLNSLRKVGFCVEQQVPIQVYFEEELVGDYFADLIVDDAVIIELKVAENLVAAHEAQLVNYLRATRFEVGLLLNFGPTPEFRRKVFSNDRKKWSSRKNIERG